MNRPTELRRALASVFAGSMLPDQIIVSDDGDGSGKHICDEFEGVQYQQGPRRGLGANRNACIQAASGQLLAFIDDDVEVSKDFIQIATNCLTDRVTTGWELNHASEPAKKVTAHGASFLGFQNRPQSEVFESIVINSTVFPIGLFDQAKFDENIQYGYEEIDMARQATRYGWNIDYSDKLHVEHFPSVANRDTYAKSLAASRLYLTFKAYQVYEGHQFKALAFAIVGTLHHIASALKRREPVLGIIHSLTLAHRYWQSDCRQRSTIKSVS